MSKGHITAYHPTKGTRRFSAGIWAAMGPDKQGFTERAPMPDELKAPSKVFIPAEGEMIAMESDPVHEITIHSAEEMEGELERRLINNADQVASIVSEALEHSVMDVIKEDEAAVAKAKKGRKPKAI